MEIAEASAKVAGEAETFCGDTVTAGAPRQPSDVGGTNGKVVRVEVPFLVGWPLGAKEIAPSRKGLAVVVGVEVPLAVVGTAPEVAACSKGNVATTGVVRELLRSRVEGSGLAYGSVLIIGVGEITPRGVEVQAGLSTGRGSTRLFFAKMASGRRDTSREDDTLCREGGFLGPAKDNGNRVGSFLVGSPTWVGEVGAPTGEAGTVWRSFCVGDFTNSEAERLLGSLGTGRGETGIPRVVVT